MVADQAWLEGYLDLIEAVTADDVQRVARARLDERQRTVGHYLPDVAAGDDAVPAEDDAAAEADGLDDTGEGDDV